MARTYYWMQELHLDIFQFCLWPQTTGRSLHMLVSQKSSSYNSGSPEIEWLIPFSFSTNTLETSLVEVLWTRIFHLSTDTKRTLLECHLTCPTAQLDSGHGITAISTPAHCSRFLRHNLEDFPPPQMGLEIWQGITNSVFFGFFTPFDDVANGTATERPLHWRLLWARQIRTVHSNGRVSRLHAGNVINQGEQCLLKIYLNIYLR